MEGKHSEKERSKALFFRAMTVTVCAVMLILIGYLSAGYFFG